MLVLRPVKINQITKPIKMQASNISSSNQTEIKEGIVKKAWTNSQYKSNLLNDPVTECRKDGLTISDKVLQMSKEQQKANFKLPEAPSNFLGMNKAEQTRVVATTVSATPEMF